MIRTIYKLRKLNKIDNKNKSLQNLYLINLLL